MFSKNQTIEFYFANSSNSKRDSRSLRTPEIVIVTNKRARPVRPASSLYSSSRSYSII